MIVCSKCNSKASHSSQQVKQLYFHCSVHPQYVRQGNLKQHWRLQKEVKFRGLRDEVNSQRMANQKFVKFDHKSNTCVIALSFVKCFLELDKPISSQLCLSHIFVCIL